MIEPAAKSRHTYSFNDFTLDLERGCLWRGAEEVKLRPKVFEALKYLVLNDNRLVAKDELIKALWPDSFVTDDSLVQCLVELRRALGDEAQACIKTVPRRGYIFTAGVRSAPATPPPRRRPPPRRPLPSARPRRTAIALVALALATPPCPTFDPTPGRPRTAAFTDKDSVLIADFVNTTGDDVFDGTLRQAMAVQLGQSPFLNVFPEERVRETLRYMGRPPDERVTRDLAREIAQRQGVKALLAGSISSLGRHYVINLEAVNAASGETILREQVEAESREKVLGRLGEAAATLREKLGESVGSIEKFAAPIEQATTPSLEAFKAYDLGRNRHFSGQYFEAIPLYRRAVELDPNFAIALRRARHLLRHRAGGRPRRAVLAARLRAARAGDRAREVLHLGALLRGRARRRRTRPSRCWSCGSRPTRATSFPAPTCPPATRAIGQHERALEEAREGLRLNPDAGVAYAGVALSSICLGRYAGGPGGPRAGRCRGSWNLPMAATCCMGSPSWRETRRPCSSRSTAPPERRPRRECWRCSRSTAAYAGQVRRARDLTGRAIDLAASRGLKEAAGALFGGRRLVGGRVRQLPGGEADRGSNALPFTRPERPALERARPRAVRRVGRERNGSSGKWAGDSHRTPSTGPRGCR